jgi:hypothetical protein
LHLTKRRRRRVEGERKERKNKLNYYNIKPTNMNIKA